MFNAKIYAQRRKKLKEAVGSGFIFLPGNEEAPMNYTDNQYAFRQDSTFLYYFGLDHPGLAAAIDVEEDKEYIFGNDLTIDEIVWMGPQPTISERAKRVGVNTTASLSEMENLHILKTLKAFNWNKTKAAKQLEISLPTLRKKISKYNLSP